MVESFGGTLNLTLWILLLIGSVYYSFRCLFQTKQFNDQYGFGDGAVFMTRFAGTNVGAAAVISLALLVYGPAGAWAFVAWGWVQSLLATIFGYQTVNSSWAQVEGVKATAEGYIAPLGFLILNTVLLINMSEILY